jgi:AraC family transcriptional regulator of adaptative response/methylated-DNA-[protein]-cysteine methyltransferase
VLGSVLVAESERGVCAILLGGGATELARDLARRFPHARLRRANGELDALVEKVASFLAAPTAGLDVPLDPQGTDFERRVWATLRDIPPQEVGEACAANPLAVAIPCHRVVRKDGSLAGYRWGVARKRALLEREAAA